MEEVYNRVCSLNPPFPNVPDWLLTNELFHLRTMDDFSKLDVYEADENGISEIEYLLKNGQEGYMWIDEKENKINDHVKKKEANDELIKEEQTRIKERHEKNVEFLKNHDAKKTFEKIQAKTLASVLMGETEEYKKLKESQEEFRIKSQISLLEKKEKVKKERDFIKQQRLDAWKEEQEKNRLFKEKMMESKKRMLEEKETNQKRIKIENLQNKIKMAETKIETLKKSLNLLL